MIDLRDRLALKPKEAANALGVCENTLRKLAPELPRVVRDRLVLYPVDGLREWLKAQSKADHGRIDGVVNEVLDSLGKSTKDTP
jgi:hypothetical protein